MKDGPIQLRYMITHKDGNPIPPGKEFLVLDLSDPDEREETAIMAFVEACRLTGYTELADDLEARLNRNADPDVLEAVDWARNQVLRDYDKERNR